MVLTDWKTIGTAGATIDGREILEQDLIDAAETYSKEEYTAVINSDHELWWYGNFGHVEEVRLGKDNKGRVILEAKLAPNRRLIEKNMNGQGMFTSMALWPDFAGTGRTYLSGLAVTDQPASVGTSMLKMFSRAKQPGNGENADIKLMKEFVSLPLNELNASSGYENNPSDEQKFFSKLMRFLKSESPNPNHEPEPDDKDDHEMTKEQFDALTAHNEKMLGVLSEVSKKLAKQEPNAPASESESSEEKNELAALETKVNSLDEKLTTINETFKSLLKEKPGTIPAGNDGVEEADFI